MARRVHITEGREVFSPFLFPLNRVGESPMIFYYGSSTEVNATHALDILFLADPLWAQYMPRVLPWYFPAASPE